MTKLLSLVSLDQLPGVGSADQAKLNWDNWRDQTAKLDDPALIHFAQGLADDEIGRRLLDSIFANSPFLSHCLLSDIGYLAAIVNKGPAAVLSEVIRRLKDDLAREDDESRLMADLRRARRQVALAVGLADIAGIWQLEQVVEALSSFADAGLSAVTAHLLRLAARRGDLTLADPENPERGCGFVVLAMGKLGGRELNYSSDIDLIVLFDPEIAQVQGKRGPQECFVRLTKSLVRILEERTREGYAFRTDLRLRPDPGAMPLAISTASALTYYESIGQNWERAAMIKARPVAGDLALGKAFLAELSPFIWRKNLDFWAIQDIHSIKRQIHAHKGGATIAVEGHNIKLSRGGIREIEFFAQTQQLIWGGREPQLRCPRTLDALDALVALGHVDPKTANTLQEAYHYLRRLEHRLQMVDDQQTHVLPADSQGIGRIAAFLGCDSDQTFRATLLDQLHHVEDCYAELFEEAPALSSAGTSAGSLVFTGSEPDPDTVATLNALGFRDGAKVFGLVRTWHHGRYRATRSTRSRELLTELMPSLLQALGKTTQPDLALTKFDEFLNGLPAGVQLFSLLHANPGLLDLLAEIMGGAPALADRLAGNPGLLDAVLSAGFFDPIPAAGQLREELNQSLAQARDFGDVLDLSRRWANDHRFQVGVHFLRHACSITEAGRAQSDIADAVLQGLYRPVLAEFEKVHGQIAGAGFAILAMGKLGAREMTVSSDLDLVFIYELPESTATDLSSDGVKSLPASLYFARLAQRFITALTAQTPEGRLYEIDMRLRPSGNAGPIATSLTGFRKYYRKDAWTWEHMALTRARVVNGEPDFTAHIQSAIETVLTAPRDADKLLCDVADMRNRIEREHPATTIWSVKYLRGGLVDLEFLAQYLLLKHLHDHPALLDGATQAVFAKLSDLELIDSAIAARLIDATGLIQQIQGLLRLTVGPAFDADTGPDSLKASLARAGGAPDFVTLRSNLVAAAEDVHGIFVDMIEEPAKAAAQRLKTA